MPATTPLTHDEVQARALEIYHSAFNAVSENGGDIIELLRQGIMCEVEVLRRTYGDAVAITVLIEVALCDIKRQLDDAAAVHAQFFGI